MHTSLLSPVAAAGQAGARPRSPSRTRAPRATATLMTKAGRHRTPAGVRRTTVTACALLPMAEGRRRHILPAMPDPLTALDATFLELCLLYTSDAADEE